MIAENTDFLQPMGVNPCATVASDHVAVSINASAQSRCKNSRNYYAEIKRNSAGFLRVFQYHAWELVLIAPPSAKYECHRWHSAWVSPPATEAVRPRREQTHPCGYSHVFQVSCTTVTYAISVMLLFITLPQRYACEETLRARYQTTEKLAEINKDAQQGPLFRPLV